MLRLNTIKKQPGATHSIKRVGRGVGSRLGKTSGRGGKGQTARTGSSIRIGFEGGQTPLYRRLPKRGFKAMVQRTRTLNVGLLDQLDSGVKEISLNTMRSVGWANGHDEKLAILGTGELKRAFTVKAHRISESAQKKIEAAGGKVEKVLFPRHPLRTRNRDKKKSD